MRTWDFFAQAIKKTVTDMTRVDFNTILLKKQLCFPLYAASRQAIKMYRPYLDPLGLTYTQYITMLVLWEQGMVSAGELGRRLLLDSGTLTPVLKSLEARGLVKRYRSSEDERVLNVELTAEGEALREKALEVPDCMFSEQNINHDEAKQLSALLYKLIGVDPE